MRRCRICGRRIWSWRIGWLVLPRGTVYFHPACWRRRALGRVVGEVGPDGTVRFRPGEDEWTQ